MPVKFHGSLEQLKERLAHLELVGGMGVAAKWRVEVQVQGQGWASLVGNTGHCVV
jgi:hypothetical protein